jgi:hypothetical protein
LEQAALLACGERALLSHHSAAFVWGPLKAHPLEVEVSVIRTRCDSRKGTAFIRYGEIDRREVRHHEGPWVSSPARAVLEIGATARWNPALGVSSNIGFLADSGATSSLPEFLATRPPAPAE